MRGQQERSGSLFSYVSTEERIPKAHPLRQVLRLADQALDRLHPTFCRLYPEGGRPSIPPEQLLRGQGQDDAKRSAQRCITAVQEATRLAAGRGWLA